MTQLLVHHMTALSHCTRMLVGLGYDGTHPFVKTHRVSYYKSTRTALAFLVLIFSLDLVLLTNGIIKAVVWYVTDLVRVRVRVRVKILYCTHS